MSVVGTQGFWQVIEILAERRRKGFIASANGRFGWGYHPYTQNTEDSRFRFNNYNLGFCLESLLRPILPFEN